MCVGMCMPYVYMQKPKVDVRYLYCPHIISETGCYTELATGQNWLANKAQGLHKSNDGVAN